MKCPNCGYNSFDYLEECRKCKLPLSPSQDFISLYKSVPRKKLEEKTRTDDNRVKKSYDEEARDSGATGAGVSDRLQESYEDVHIPTGPDKEAEIPAFYKTGSDEAPQVSVRNDEEKLTYPQEPEADIAGHKPDPALYSESPNRFDATNLEDPQDSKEEAQSYSLAGLNRRAAAFIIDIVIIALITFLTIGAGFYILSDSGVESLELSRVYLPIYALLFFLASTYFVFLHFYAGRTLGKMAVGIKVINSEGSEVGLWESFMRWVGYYISAVFLFAGFIWAGFDEDSQAWHDKIAGTYVVIG